jgi:hypothetical protein
MKFLLSLILFCVAASSSIAQVSQPDLRLGCDGIEDSQHFEKHEKISAIVTVMLEQKLLTITTVERVYDAASSKFVRRESTEQYTIELNTPNFLTFVRSVAEEEAYIFKTTDNMVKVPVLQDDVAEGTLNRITGTIHVQTRHYSELDTEKSNLWNWFASFFPEAPPSYGWMLELTCKQSLSTQ